MGFAGDVFSMKQTPLKLVNHQRRAKMLIDFLKTKRSKEELQLALDVLREFVDCESDEEYFIVPFEAWAKVGQFLEFLEHLVEGKPLEDDTKHEIEKCTRKEPVNGGTTN